MPYLPAAIASVVAQQGVEHTVLAIDDGSTDGSLEYLLGLEHPRLSVLHQENRGLGAVLNRGIALCQTPFLARMDADDISEPHRLRMQMEVMARSPSVVLVGSQLDFLIHDKRQKGLAYPTQHDQIVGDLMDGKWSLSHATLLMRTEAARRSGGYRITGAGEDLDFCLLMSECGRVANVPQALYLYRLHGSSISITRQRELARGYAYARHTATERRRGMPESSLEQFYSAWNRRSTWHRYAELCSSVSNLKYREARVHWAFERKFRALRCLVTAGMLRPSLAWRVSRRLLEPTPPAQPPEMSSADSYAVH
jgi:glycosyltransferase involved in cell wall biosynthesis